MPCIYRKPGSTVNGIMLQCQAHVPEEERIKWDGVRILTVADVAKYEEDLDAAYTLVGSQPAKAKALWKVIASVVSGWSNFVDESGAPVPFDESAADLFNLQQLYQFAIQIPAAAGWGSLH